MNWPRITETWNQVPRGYWIMEEVLIPPLDKPWCPVLDNNLNGTWNVGAQSPRWVLVGRFRNSHPSGS